MHFEAGAAGLYALRTQFIEPDPAGVYNGMKYQGLRQTATLTMRLPIGEISKAGQ